MNAEGLADWKRSSYCGDLRLTDEGQTVTVMGWVHTRRDHGGLIFVDLRDRSGVVQIVFNPEQNQSTFAFAQELRNEFVVAVRGRVERRPEETQNPNLATGAIEVMASEAKLLSQARSTPFPIDGGPPITESTRLKYRYLDLRRPEMQERLIFRHRLVKAMRDYLDGQGFIEIETPLLTRSTPEGARDYLVPSRVNPGCFYALPQSPQLYKQLLMISGFDRYFQLARCFRDEDLRADRQPEFTQIDIEASFIGQEDIISLTEGMLAAIFEEAGFKVPAKFERLRYADAMERFGCDRPDTRYALEIFDASDVFRGSEFGIATQALNAGGRIRGLRIPGGAALSRKQVDEIEATAKSAGAPGLIRLKRGAAGLEGSVAKFLDESSAERLALAEGDLGLFVAGAEHVSNPALDRVRQGAAARLSLVPEHTHSFTWVTDFPMFIREQNGTLSSVHHPFTAPNPEDLHLLESSPEKVRALAYDVVLNGTELGGGSIRINDPVLQRKVLSLLGIDSQTAQARFGFLLEALSAGAPPHGGIALGFDRIAMMLAGATSLRDVIAFPKTTAARALFEGAPSTVPPEELRELHLQPMKT